VRSRARFVPDILGAYVLCGVATFQSPFDTRVQVRARLTLTIAVLLDVLFQKVN
jgi:hypothetical protein